MKQTENSVKPEDAYQVVSPYAAMKITGHSSIPALKRAVARGDIPAPITIGPSRWGFLLRELLAHQERMVRERDERLRAKAEAEEAA